jgi:large subunit ribosomal protein L24
MKIKKNDSILVIAGKDKGKTGKVTQAFPKESKVLISGINMRKKHQKARKSGEKGQILDVAFPIHVSNVMLVTDSGKRTRTRSKI